MLEKDKCVSFRPMLFSSSLFSSVWFQYFDAISLKGAELHDWQLGPAGEETKGDNSTCLLSPADEPCGYPFRRQQSRQVYILLKPFWTLPFSAAEPAFICAFHSAEQRR